MTFDVCICTHSPKKDVFHRVITALGQQTLNRDDFRVVVIDNASHPKLALDDEPFRRLQSLGIQVVLIEEPKLGVAQARLRALRESNAPAILFVDDDNVIDVDFLENAKAILQGNPEVGCFSGKIKVPDELSVPKWIKPLLGALAIRDEGDSPIIDWFRGGWVAWLPVATASMVVTKPVIEAFLKNHGTRDEFSTFGRKGSRGLMSGEDYFIALSAADAGLKCGYFPNLRMWHFINVQRFRFWYMARLFFSYGLTDVKRETYLQLDPGPFKLKELGHRVLAKDLKTENFRARFCYWLYQIVYVAGRSLKLTRSRRLFFTREK